VLAPVFERLRALAGSDGHVELDAISDHYDDASRAALHHVERTLFEAPSDAVAPPSPDGIVRLLGAGGERAEIELVAAEVLRELRAGTEPGQVAVVFRDPPSYGSIIEQVFTAYGIPFSIDRTVPLAHTALGRSLLALLRCAACDGTADDLLAYLRSPGLLDHPELADRLEADVRQSGIRGADAARAAWQESGRWELTAIDRLRTASERGVAALLEELDRQLQYLFTRPYRRTAHVFSGEERDDPRVWTSARAAIGQLRALVERRSLPWLKASDVHDALSELPVRLGDDPRPERVQVATPEAIRARRFEVVIVAGLQEGEFPRPAAPEPFLPDDDRHEIAAATGLRLPMRDDQLDRERYLFYVCASRAERVLMLSSRFSDEEGGPQVGSFFLQDVVDLFEPGALTRARTRRALADVTWNLENAPTAAEWERALALAGPRFQPPAPDGLSEPAVLDSLADRQLSTSALEAYSDCPVKWLVDRVLRPEELEPDPEYMVRGNYAHAVLELTYLRLHERTGERKVTRANLGVAEQILGEALREKQSEFQLSPQETRVRAAVRKLEFDLLRHLRRESESGGTFEPAHVELSFGGGIAPPLEIDGVTLSGKIDRVDVHGDLALVRDYKSGATVWPVARWEEDRRIQVALYMIAVRELLDLKPVAGFYVPLSGQNPRPRGVVQAGLEADVGAGIVKQDVKDPDEIEELLDGARRQVGELAREMRTGVLRPCPDTCSFRGGCTYPSICRAEG
jgi:ATP-dependent helicase/DNAse subunit B